MDPEILVRGTGQARVLPDRALVRVTVEGEGGSREEAYRQAEGLAAQVDRVVAAHAGAVDRTVTTALSVQPKTRWRRGESVRTGWRASRTTSLDVTDLARLGDLFADLVGAGGAVAGPYWQVDPDNAVYDEARRRAAADARRRAAAYAAALGLAVGAVAWVAEPGLRPTAAGPQAREGATHMAMAAAARGEMPEEVIEVEPEEVVVDAAVDVGFAVAPAGRPPA